MNKLFFVDLGYLEPTVIYELVPKKVASLRGASLAEIESYLHDKNVRHIVIDSAEPRAIDELRIDGFNIIKGRIPRLDKLNDDAI